MSLTLLYVLSIFMLLAITSGGILFFRYYLKKRQMQYESRIKSLEHELADAHAQVGQEAAQLKSVQGSNVYEKYAGLILAQMNRAVVFINQDGTVGLINEYAKQFLNLNAAVGMPYKDVLHIRKAGAEDNYSLFDAAFAGKAQQIPSDMEIVSQHGSVPITGIVMPLNAGQTSAAVVCIFEDNSEQVARVKEEQAFFSAAAHELRTPLTIIRMTVSLLRENYETMPKEKIAEHLRRTDETTERLVRLVNEFLSISRIDQGRLEIKPEKFDIVTLTDEVIANLGLLAKQRKLYVHHELDVERRMVMADRAKTAEVLTNLISNGLKYTIQGGLTISHKISDSTLTTSVTDTGAGISRESHSLLFKRFGQIGQAHNQDTSKSTGLGLYISKKLAQMMRGDVVLVKSEPGSGSVFAFMLPLG